MREHVLVRRPAISTVISGDATKWRQSVSYSGCNRGARRRTSGGAHVLTFVAGRKFQSDVSNVGMRGDELQRAIFPCPTHRCIATFRVPTQSGSCGTSRHQHILKHTPRRSGSVFEASHSVRSTVCCVMERDVRRHTGCDIRHTACVRLGPEPENPDIQHSTTSGI